MKHLLEYNTFRVENDASLFTEEESLLFDDLLLEYVDKYGMIEMPKDEYGDHFFDEEIDKIQYLVQRLRNIGIDIECNNKISLDEVFEDLKKHFVPRVEKFGYRVFHFSNHPYNRKNVISITIMKNNQYYIKPV